MRERFTKFKPETKNQSEYVRSIEVNNLTFCLGPAGTGKTLLACQSALQMVLDENRPYQKIVITRPPISCGKELGFLPGSLSEKFEPWIRPLLDCFYQITNKFETTKLFMDGKIEAVPTAVIGGLSLHNSIVICDEQQNSSFSELVRIITRLGHNSKIIICGDIEQRDLNGKAPILDLIKKVRKHPSVGVIRFDNDDILRSGFVKEILKLLNKTSPRNNFFDISAYHKVKEFKFE